MVQEQVSPSEKIVATVTGSSVYVDGLSQRTLDILDNTMSSVGDIMADMTIAPNQRPIQAARFVRSTWFYQSYPNEEFRGSVRDFLEVDCGVPVTDTPTPVVHGLSDLQGRPV